MQAEPFKDAQTALQFIRAGNARVTLVSQRTNMRYTYKVVACKDDVPTDPRRRYFVSLLKGRDNNSDYSYIGMLRAEHFFVTRATRHLAKAAFVAAFEYVTKHLAAGHLPPHAQIWHESKCGRCGRALTVPSSISTGIGPECAKFVGVK